METLLFHIQDEKLIMHYKEKVFKKTLTYTADNYEDSNSVINITEGKEKEKETPISYVKSSYKSKINWEINSSIPSIQNKVETLIFCIKVLKGDYPIETDLLLELEGDLKKGVQASIPKIGDLITNLEVTLLKSPPIEYTNYTILDLSPKDMEITVFEPAKYRITNPATYEGTHRWQKPINTSWEITKKSLKNKVWRLSRNPKEGPIEALLKLATIVDGNITPRELTALNEINPFNAQELLNNNSDIIGEYILQTEQTIQREIKILTLKNI